MLTILDEEKREAKARKEEERTKKIAEKQSGDENKRPSTLQAQPRSTSEDERSAVSEAVVFEPAPYLDPVSLEESSGPTSKTSRAEANFTNQDSSNKSPVEEQPRSVTGGASEADAVSEVDPTLLDPALRESVIDELPMPEKDSGEFRPSDHSHAKLVAARVLSAPSINDVPIEEVTKAVRDATSVHQDLVADPSHSSEAIVSDERNVRQDLVADPSRASDLTKVPDETNISRSLLPNASRPAKVVALDDITGQQTLVSDPSHGTEATNTTTPRSPKSESKVTSWLKSKFGRRTAKPHEPQVESNNQDLVGIEDDERHKEELRGTSRSVSSISSDEGARENISVLKQNTYGSHEDFKEAHNHPDIGKDSEERATSIASRDAGHVHDNHVRDSKFQENL